MSILILYWLYKSQFFITCAHTRKDPAHLGLAVQEFDGFFRHLQQHFLCPDFVFGVQQLQLLDGIIYCSNGLWFIHDECREMLQTHRWVWKVIARAMQCKQTLLFFFILIFTFHIFKMDCGTVICMCIK